MGCEDAGSLHLFPPCLHLLARHTQATNHHCMHMTENPFLQVQGHLPQLWPSLLLKCLKRNKISKAGSCSKSFHCSTNSITNPFSNGGSREMPLSSYTKVFLMLTQVDEILPILIVYCCSIRNLFLFAQKCTLSQVVNEISLKELVDSHCIMMKRVTYYDIIDGAAHQHSCNKWVYGCLWIIPVELGCILQHSRIILGNVSHDQRFS